VATGVAQDCDTLDARPSPCSLHSRARMCLCIMTHLYAYVHMCHCMDPGRKLPSCFVHTLSEDLSISLCYIHVRVCIRDSTK